MILRENGKFMVELAGITARDGSDVVLTVSDKAMNKDVVEKLLNYTRCVSDCKLTLKLMELQSSGKFKQDKKLSDIFLNPNIQKVDNIYEEIIRKTVTSIVIAKVFKEAYRRNISDDIPALQYLYDINKKNSARILYCINRLTQYLDTV